MKIEKIGSKYRIRPMINGKRHCITLDHKPTQREVSHIIEEMKSTVEGDSTFETAAKGMIKDKSNVLSPSTIRGYNNVLKGLSKEFKRLAIIMISSSDIQREINQLSVEKSPKTVSNYYGFISSVLGYYRPLTKFNVKLPQKQVKRVYTPTTEDIRVLLSDCSTNGYGTKYIFPIMLGCYGMRLGEITALTDKDIDTTRNLITINKSKVYTTNNDFVIKPTPKTDKSNRVIQVSDEAIEAYVRYGLYEKKKKTISDYMRRRQEALGLEHFSFHKLRHYFASISMDNGIPLPTIQDFGGWSSPRTLQKIYQHNMRDFSEISDVVSLSFVPNRDNI